MAKVSAADLVYAIRHPVRAVQYVMHRDRIGYDVCLKYLPPDPVIVEAGAYDGTNTREFCEQWPGCRVYAFEPVPDAYEKLLRVAAVFPGRIFPQRMALGEKVGMAEMHVSRTGSCGGQQSSSLLAPRATRQEFPHVRFLEDKIAVPVARIDEWAAEAGVTRIDFLWLDLQGVELAALKGCGNLLGSVSAVHCEVQNLPLYEGAVLYPELSDWFARNGFKIAREAVFRRGGNVLFVRDARA